MIQDFQGKTAVLTGAGSGFGLECARLGARLGMNLVLVDVQKAALDAAAEEMRAAGVKVLAQQVDVSNRLQMEVLAHSVQEPGIRQQLEDIGLVVETMTPQQLHQREQAYTGVWKRIIEDSGFKPQ